MRADRPPTVDGRLDDSAWTLAPAVTDLRQTDPDEGAAVSESTEVRILYDATAFSMGRSGATVATTPRPASLRVRAAAKRLATLLAGGDIPGISSRSVSMLK